MSDGWMGVREEGSWVVWDVEAAEMSTVLWSSLVAPGRIINDCSHGSMFDDYSTENILLLLLGTYFAMTRTLPVGPTPMLFQAFNSASSSSSASLPTADRSASRRSVHRPVQVRREMSRAAPPGAGSAVSSRFVSQLTSPAPPAASGWVLRVRDGAAGFEVLGGPLLGWLGSG